MCKKSLFGQDFAYQVLSVFFDILCSFPFQGMPGDHSEAPLLPSLSGLRPQGRLLRSAGELDLLDYLDQM